MRFHRSQGRPSAAWIALGLAAGTAAFGCRDGTAPCAALCARARACQREVAAALAARIPQQSPAGRRAARWLAHDLTPELLAVCPERCGRLWHTARLRAQTRTCLATQPCAAFGRCVAPLLEP